MTQLQVAFRPSPDLDVGPDDLADLLALAAARARANPQTPWELVAVRDGASVYGCDATPWPA